MIRIGVIGCGKIAEKHLEAYNMLEDIDVTVADNVEKLSNVAESFGVKWSNSIDRLIEQSDAIDICTPTPSHFMYLAKALTLHKHIFVEKPMTATLDEARSIEEMARNAKTVAMVGHPYRFHPRYQFVRKALRERIIGKPYLAVFRIGGRGEHKAWKHLKETGGGAANEMLVHMLDITQWLLGDILVEDSYTGIILPNRTVEGKEITIDTEDIVVIRLKANGTTVIGQADLITPAYTNYIDIQGDKGSLFTSAVECLPTVLYLKDGNKTDIKQFPKVNWFKEELGYWLDCIRRGFEPGANTIGETVKTMEVLENIKTQNIAST